MKRSATDKVFMLLIRLAAIMAMFTFVQVTCAQEILLAPSPPAVIYYTTNGTEVFVPNGEPSTASAPLQPETISLVPNAGRGTSYVKPHKLKIHESKHEFEKHIKQKHGKRFRVETFKVKQTEHGLEGYIDIIENRDPGILQLESKCTEDEWARRVAIAREFIVNYPELIGLTENEELRVLTRERNNCGNIYFDRFVNGYELLGSGFQVVFRPQYNYSIYANLRLITPEMYAMAQQKALTEAEVATIVYTDMNIPVPDNTDKSAQKLPKLQIRKYLRNREPYAIWEVRDRYLYEINAVTGEITFKQLNIQR